jgi:hypothetical protein
MAHVCAANDDSNFIRMMGDLHLGIRGAPAAFMWPQTETAGDMGFTSLSNTMTCNLGNANAGNYSGFRKIK